MTNGKDVFEEAAISVYDREGLTVKFMDGWNAHHNGGGETHCGTNTIRQTDPLANLGGKGALVWICFW